MERSQVSLCEGLVRIPAQTSHDPQTWSFLFHTSQNCHQLCLLDQIQTTKGDYFPPLRVTALMSIAQFWSAGLSKLPKEEKQPKMAWRDCSQLLCAFQGLRKLTFTHWLPLLPLQCTKCKLFSWFVSKYVTLFLKFVEEEAFHNKIILKRQKYYPQSQIN